MAQRAGNVHIGKAAAVIVIGLLLGLIVLRSDGSAGGTSVSAAERAALAAARNTTTTTTARRSNRSSSTTTTPARAPSTVKVIAINGTKVAGQAGKATTKLQNATYNVLAPGNATAAVRNTNPASVVYVVTPGYEREAAAVAAVLGLPPTSVKPLPSPSPSTDIKNGVNIAVLVGSGITL
ncbi:MAG: LytR cell envelope-related transcriptional attenuator [Actinomycetota bacterium]|jgi:hypothetical protein